MIRHIVVVLSLLAGTAAQIQAQPADLAAKWRGVKVLPKWDCVVKVGNETIKRSKLNIPWTVQEVNGEWLWVGGDLKGWVQKSQVVTVDEAPAYYTQLIRCGREKAWAYHHRAAAWEEKGNLDLAIADYGNLLRLEPDAVAYNNRGVAWKAGKEFGKAIADYDEAIRLDPHDATPYNNRGNAWCKTKEYDKAILDYNEAIRLDPTFSRAYYNRADTWHNKQEYHKALADYDQAIRLDPNYASAYYNRACIWHDMNEYDRATADYKAIADYNQTIRLKPDDCDGMGNLAWILATSPDARLRNGDRAVELARKDCELTGWKDGVQIDILAAAYAEAGDFDSAIKFAKKAAELDPDTPRYLRHVMLFQDHKPIRR